MNLQTRTALTREERRGAEEALVSGGSGSRLGSDSLVTLREFTLDCIVTHSDSSMRSFNIVTGGS